MAKLTAIQLNALAHMFAGKTIAIGFESAGALVAAGMISEMPSFGDVVTLSPDLLTLSGRVQGESRYAYINRATLAKNARAKFKAEAMRDLGMKRTARGWE